MFWEVFPPLDHLEAPLRLWADAGWAQGAATAAAAYPSWAARAWPNTRPRVMAEPMKLPPQGVG